MTTAAPTSTRKDTVLRHLEKFANTWVNGSDLTKPTLGGSEGTRRVRELRAEGHAIEKRVHPEGLRLGYQYRLVLAKRPAVREIWTCETCGTQADSRPQVIMSGLGVAKCPVCRSRRYFKAA